MPFTLEVDQNVSRRGAILAAGCALTAGCVVRGTSSESRDPGPWYALLADTHIAADPREKLRGEVMADHLREAVRQILAASRPPEGVIVNGDLAFETGVAGDYTSFLQIVAPWKIAGIPIHITMGNHDDRGRIREAIAGLASEGAVEDKIVGAVEGEGIRFVMLDSQDGVNVTAGRLGDPQLAWLAEDLDAHPGVPTILVVHHHLDPTARPALRDTNALLDVIRPRRQVKAVVSGHTHVWSMRLVEEIAWIHLPAVGYRFQPREPLGWVELRPASWGARIHLRCVGGNLALDGQEWSIFWRAG